MDGIVMESDVVKIAGVDGREIGVIGSMCV